MWALRKSGVRLIVHEDGTKETWLTAKLAPWEAPRCDPSEPRQAPEVMGSDRAAGQRSLDRKHEREAAQLAAERHQERNIDGGDGELPDN